jgi:N-acetylglucosaminyl-diphospho-decaprenol L-rhamnosyltransferase
MEEKSDRRLSLFVVHWNQPVECVATVQAMSGQGIPLRVTVMDNASDLDAFQSLQARLDPAVNIVRLTENKGWGGALNIALRKWLNETRDPHCFICSHDARPEPDCLRRMIEAADAESRTGIICPQYPDPFVGRFSALRGVYPEKVAARVPGSAQSVDVPHGTLMFLQRECLEGIGLFDERYFAYGDEHELGARAVRQGWKVIMVWGAIVTNPGTSIASPLRSYLFARNSLLLVRDYFGRPAAWVRAILIVGNTLRLMLVRRDEGFAFSARARWQGVRDYLTGRFGPQVLR